MFIFSIIIIQLSLIVCDPIRLENFQLVHHDNKPFPDTFSIRIDQLGHARNFKRSQNYVLPQVSILKDGKAEIFEFKNQEKHEIYTEINGDGFATVVLGNDNKLRMYGRIFEEDKHYDIMPELGKNARLNSNNQAHLLYKRALKPEINNLNFGQDFIPNPNYKPKENINKKRQRAFNGQPIVADVETLVVIDPTVYQDHKKLLNSSDDSKIFEHIRVYYAHTMNGVNEKYQNSLKTDPDLRINIKLVHVLILTVCFRFLEKRLKTFLQNFI